VLNSQSRVLGDGNVVSPGRRREVDRLGRLMEFAKEGHGNAEGTSPGDRLGNGEL
jgi:hypothetical protein